MPITTFDPRSLTTTAGPSARSVAVVAGQTAPVELPAAQPSTGFGEALGASIRMSPTQSITNAVGKQFLGFKSDPTFNPFAFIESQMREGGAFGRPEKRDQVMQMVERGQFDGSTSEDEFWHDFRLAERFFEDAAALQRASTGTTIAAMAPVMLGDFTNFIPVGGAFAAAGKVASKVVKAEIAAKALTGAVVAGGLGVGVKKVQDALTPVANEPGITDEVIATAISAGLGAAIGAATSEAVTKPFLTGVRSEKLNALRAGIDRTLHGEEFRPGFKPALGAANPRETLGFSPDGIDAADTYRGGLVEAYEANNKHLIDALEEPAIDNKVVTLLSDGSDDNAKLAAQLREKYAQAGKTVHIVDHGKTADYRLAREAERILAVSEAALPADAADLSAGFADRAFMAVGRFYAKASGGVGLVFSSPASRLSRSMLGAIQETQRALFGSVQTVSRGSATAPGTYEVGANAEGLKDVMRAKKDGVVRELIGIFRDARKTAQSPMSVAEFRESIGRRMRAMDDQARGYDTPTPIGTPGEAAAVKVVREYFGDYRARLEEAGLLSVGPRALKQAEDDLARISASGDEAAISAATKNVERIREAVKAQDDYLPIVIRKDRVKDSPNDFVDRVRRGLREADLMVDGRRVSPDAAPLRDEVIEQIGREKVNQIARDRVAKPNELGVIEEPPQNVLDKAIDELTVADLPADLRAAYDAQLDAFYRRTAEGVRDHLIGGGDNVPAAWTGAAQALHERTLAIPKSILGDFVEHDIEQILAQYHRSMSGRYAVARAIQTNPRLAALTKADGSAIRTGEDLEQALLGGVDSLIAFQRMAEETGAIAAEKSARTQLGRLRDRMVKDLFGPMRELEGRHVAPGGHGPTSDLGPFLTRTLLGANYLSKMGSALLANVNDAGVMVVQAMTNRHARGRIVESILGMSGMTKRELQSIAVLFDHEASTVALGDLPDLVESTGAGHGLARRATRAIDHTMHGATRLQSKVSLLSWWNQKMRRIYGGIEIDTAIDKSRRIITAQSLIDGGMDQAAAFRKAGLDPYDAARLNKMGFNAKRSQLFHEQVYKHGTLDDGRKVSDAMSFAEYMATKRRVHPEMASWDDTAEIRNLIDTVTSNLSQEATRFRQVTPGVLDRPLLNQKSWGKLLNQFQSYTFAFSNQRLAPMGQMGANRMLPTIASTMFLSAVGEAIQSHLNGRRTFEQTAQMWRDNPIAMMYLTWTRSGLAGWLARPLGASDMLGVGISPGTLLEAPVGSGAARHVQSDRFLSSVLGPTASDSVRAFNVFKDLSNGKVDAWTGYNAGKLLPFNNLLWARALYKATGLPTAPEWMLDRARSGSR